MKKILHVKFQWPILIWFTNKKTVISVPYVPKPEPKVKEFRATKAYADERQKMPRNRKRHPSKKMRNLYQALER
jgi:hypothetical protein